MDTVDFMRQIDLPLAIVGGAVRNNLLGIPADDHDFIALDSDVTDIKIALSCFGRVEDLIVAKKIVGVRFHPHARIAPGGVEICPPRKEISTGPGHKDFDIVADASVPFSQDAIRRDFTINAMAQDLRSGELLDPLNGAEDLRNGILRTTTPDSFRDDPLRILRGLRFIAQLNLDPSTETGAQMREFASGIANLSGERIFKELRKLLMGNHAAKALRIARDTGALSFFLPELDSCRGFAQESKFHDLNTDEHIFEVVRASVEANSPLEVRMAALLHDCGKPESAWRGEDGHLHFYSNSDLNKEAHEIIGARKAAVALKRICAPVDFSKTVVHLIAHHMERDENSESPARARRFLNRHGERRARLLIQLKKADVLGKSINLRTSPFIAKLDELEAMVSDEISAANAFTRKDLAIKGGDVIAAGISPGPQVGVVIDHLLALVIDNPALNNADDLLREVKNARL